MRKSIIIALIILTCHWAQAQQQKAFLYAHNKGIINGKQRIELKWFTEQIQAGGGVFVYRQQENQKKWERVNDKPIKLQNSIPDRYKEEDKEPDYYEELVRHQNSGKVKGILLLSLWVKAFQSKPFAEYMGIYFEDSTVVTGNKYIYKVVFVTKGGVKDLAQSKPITAFAKETMEEPVQSVQLKAQKKRVEFMWQEESERFWAVNIYRKGPGMTEFKKVNQHPVMNSLPKDKDGKELPIEKMYEDDSLSENTFYEYKITALDFFGYESKVSGSYPIYIKDRTAPESPKLAIDSVYKLRVWLKWTAPIDTDLKGFNIYRSAKSDGPYIKLTDTPLALNAMSFTEEVQKPSAYYYFVSAIDTAGNEAPSERVIANVEDVFPPAMPKELSVKADTGFIRLAWKANTEKDLWGYYIYRGLNPSNPKSMVLLNANPITAVSFNDTINKVAKNKFYYRIAAVDSSYNASQLTEALGATMPDIIPPSKPFISKIMADKGIIMVKWIPNKELDLKGYHLFVINEATGENDKITKELIPSSSNVYQYKALSEKTEYRFRLAAIDSAGNQSELSATYSYFYNSTNRASEKDKLKLEAKAEKDKKTIQLKWTYSGKKEIKGYVVYAGIGETMEMKALTGLLTKTSYKDLASDSEEASYQVRVYCTDGTIIRSEYKKVKLR
jgi:hypothetical protein